MTMARNLNERKKGIRDVCKEDGRGFGTIVILPLCHSASHYLFITNPSLSVSLFSATFLTKSLCLPLLILSQLIPISVFSACVSPTLLTHLPVLLSGIISKSPCAKLSQSGFLPTVLSQVLACDQPENL